MTQQSWPYKGQPMNEGRWRSMARVWRASGVIDGVGGMLAVTKVAGALQVQVASGDAWLDGFYFTSDAVETLNLQTADLNAERIDRVIVRSTPEVGAALAVLTGTPGAGAPALTRNKGGVWEESLFRVPVPAASGEAGVPVDERVVSSAPGRVTFVADAAARDALDPQFVFVGRMVYREDATKLEVWDGTTWRDANAAYVAKAGAKLHVPAAQMKDTFGAPTLAGIGSAADKSHVAWLLDATSPENLTGQIVVPADWNTVDIALWWTNAGTGTGDVKYHLITHNVANGATLGTGSVATSPGASQAPAQNVAKADLIASGLAVTPGNSFGFRLQRDAGNATDTLPNDCGVIAVEIRRKS